MTYDAVYVCLAADIPSPEFHAPAAEIDLWERVDPAAIRTAQSFVERNDALKGSALQNPVHCDPRCGCL